MIHSHSCTVLVVDDAVDVRVALSHLLSAVGYEVESATDGDDALNQLRQGLRPCLILLDLHMPNKDGFEFRKAQLTEPALAAIPVVLFSGHEDVEAAAKQLQVSAYFQKPIVPDELLDLVASTARAN